MPRTILIVDDEPELVVPLKEGLEAAGYRVAVAFDGAQGLLLAHQARPDLVILDLNMPAGDGGSMYALLRERPDTAGIPVVFSTGAALEELRGRVEPGPGTYFLRKPAGLSAILGVVGRLLGGGGAPEAPRAAGAPSPAPSPPPPSPVPRGGGPGAARTHEFEARAEASEGDRSGRLSEAFAWRCFERGREELLGALGARLRELEAGRRLLLPAVRSRARWAAPCRAGASLLVRTWLEEVGPASVAFACEISDQDRGGRLAAELFSRHAVSLEGRLPARLPADLRARLAPHAARRGS